MEQLSAGHPGPHSASCVHLLHEHQLVTGHMDRSGWCLMGPGRCGTPDPPQPASRVHLLREHELVHHEARLQPRLVAHHVQQPPLHLHGKAQGVRHVVSSGRQARGTGRALGKWLQRRTNSTCEERFCIRPPHEGGVRCAGPRRQRVLKPRGKPCVRVGVHARRPVHLPPAHAWPCAVCLIRPHRIRPPAPLKLLATAASLGHNKLPLVRHPIMQ